MIEYVYFLNGKKVTEPDDPFVTLGLSCANHALGRYESRLLFVVIAPSVFAPFAVA